MEEVLLDFSRIDFSDAHICDEHNLIHRSRMLAFQKIAKAQMEMAEEEFCLWSQGKGKVCNVHNTISIFANRGAGKTTFLLSAIDWIKKSYSDVLCLKPIDPSMIGCKENAFVNIIAEIHEHVVKRIDTYDYDRCNNDEICDLQRRIDSSFTKLMEALSFMDGIGKSGKYEDWDDAEFAARKGMEKAISSNNIDESFQTYVYQSLKLLGKKCIVISFDDIDTDFNKGYEILEIIRRFMTSPMIMTILTGDLELYGKLVRKASWKCFDKEFLDKEITYANRKEQEFSTMIDQLENQYLIKILKPEYRIPISTIKEYLADPDFSINVKFKKEDPENGYPIGDCYNRLLKEIGGYRQGSKLAEELKQFLLGLSLRIQIRLLSQIKELKLMRLIRYNRESLASGIQAVFWNDINQKANNAKSLIKSSPAYTSEMLKFLDYTNSMGIGSAFLPETEDEILNKALFAIGSKYNQLVERYRYLVFDYWCRISFVGTFYGRMTKQGNFFSNFLDYSLLKTDSGLVKSIGLMQAYNASMPIKEESIIGVDELPEMPFFFSDAHSILALLPSYGTVDGNRKETSFFSIYKLMALISDLMRSCNELKDEPDEKEQKIMAQLTKLGQYRTYSIPTNSGLNEDKTDNSKNDINDYYHFLFNTDLVEKEGQVQKLAHDFLVWGNKDVSVSCQSLHHIFIRFYYTMTHISGSFSIADRFSKYVLSLLNAALVESAIDSGYSGFNMSNLGDIENIFMDNVRIMKRRIRSDKKSLASFKFYNWLVSCPLLLIFIDPVVSNYLTNEKITEEEMDLSTKFHVRYKSLKYIKNHIGHQQDKLKKIEEMNRTASQIQEYKIMRMNYERNIYYLRRSLEHEDMEKMRAENMKLIDGMSEIRKSISPTLTFLGQSISFDSDMDSIEKMINIISKEKYLINRDLKAYQRREFMFMDSLSRLGFADEYKNSEEILYDPSSNKNLNVYNLIEQMFPMYHDDDESITL